MTPPPADLADAKKKFTGAMVYHKGGNDIPVGIYVWNGTNWTSMEENCKSPALTLSAPLFIRQGAPAAFSVSSDASPRCAAGETYEWFKSDVNSNTYSSSSFGSGAGASTSFTATGTYQVKVVATSPYAALIEEERSVSVTADGGPDPAMLSTAYGIVGETCLDVKRSYQEKTQEVFDDRIYAFESGFAKTYKFVHDGSYSELSLSLDDPDQIVHSISLPPADASGDTPEPFTVTFKSNVKDLVPDNGDSLTVRLYASYKDNNKDTRYAYLEIRVEDGTCICPAKISDTQWLNFMCHNLGGLDIISPSQLITYEHHGDWYRFGAKKPSLVNTGTNNGSQDWTYGSYGAIPPYYAQETGYAQDNSNWNWPDVLDDDIGNPCPAGWRLPTEPEWSGAYGRNTQAYVPDPWITSQDNLSVFSNLKKLGDDLMLPIAGQRNYTYNGLLSARGTSGYYWSSTGYNENNSRYVSFSSVNSSIITSVRRIGLSVRCTEK
jgi:uncharacterized protein (TIGR02145 family)